ncbi:MAG: hypothetical protein GXY83_07440 [Rhodopirellula sp.]|nr:hypothetical protein [Rhodopirellula sp.]
MDINLDQLLTTRSNTGWTPTLRHSWNPDNTLSQWQQRFSEDTHSMLVPIEFDQHGTGFVLQTDQRLSEAGSLPEEVRSILTPMPRVGCRRTEWIAGR